MIRRGINTELRNFFVYIAVVGIVGYVFDVLTLAALCGLFIFVLILFYRLHRLQSWIIRARKPNPPYLESHGLCETIADDVLTMLKRHEREKLRLQSIVHRVQDMTSALTDGVILIDRKDNIEWWNKSAGEMFSFRDIDIGHKLTNLIRNPTFVRYFEAFEYHEPLELNFGPGDEKQLQFLIHLFGHNERLVIVRDVTRVHKLEQMRKDFVANVTHELRTPLTVIRGYLETLSDVENSPPMWSKAMGQMLTQTSRMTALINDLLTLTRLETEEKEFDKNPVRLFPLAQTIASDARALSGEQSHEIYVEGDNNLSVRGLERELRSAISNLVYNAVNYSPPKSTITIRIESKRDGAYVSVEDNGPGIDPKHLSRLTERFYRVDSGRSVLSGGTGLGLAIVKHVLLRHNAELMITSTIGKGSCFTCFFKPSSIIENAA